MKRVGLLAALSLVVPVSVLVAAPAQATPRCFGRTATLVGTSAGEFLHGTPRRDVIVGGGGDDAIRTGDGSDLVCAGGGNDVVDVGEGRDRVSGGAGKDRLAGVSGNDLLAGGGGNDAVSGGTGDDAISGGGGNDLVSGNADQDTIHGGAGKDRLGGAQHADSVFGDEGDDVLVGEDGRDRLEGEDGNDIVDGGSGPDAMNGGPGFDYASFAVTTNANVEASLETDRASGQGSDTLDGIEGLIGSNGADTLTGDAAGNGLYGGNIGDLIKGMGGDDGIFGEDGPDELYGGTGSDHIDGGADRDICLEGEELVSCEAAGYTLRVVRYDEGLVTSDPSGIDCGLDCSGEFTPGSTVTLTALPAANTRFDGWGGACQGVLGTTCDVVMDSGKSVNAVFVRTRTVTITVDGAGHVSDDTGQISCPPDCSGTYDNQTWVELTATPEPGATFSGWSGAISGTTNPRSVYVDSDKALTATFTGP